MGLVGLSAGWLLLQAGVATIAERSKPWTQFEKPACIAHLVGRAEANGMRESTDGKSMAEMDAYAAS